MKRVGWTLSLILAAAVVLASYEFGRSSPRTSTSHPRATTTSSRRVSDATWMAVWPHATSTTAYSSPAAAARGFASGLLSMREPIVGTFRRGDARSGEVPVTPFAGGPETTVAVRQLTPSGDWWVLGSSTPDVVIDGPHALATVPTSFAVSGVGTAFEAVVDVTLWSDGETKALLRTTVREGSMGVRGRFRVTLSARGHAGPATLVMYLRSPRDGSVIAASTVRFRVRS